jgi:hypothetical protein
MSYRAIYLGIYDDLTIIDGNHVSGTGWAGIGNYGASSVLVRNNIISGFTANNIYVNSGTFVYENNTGYVTENMGTATVPNGATYIDVAHGLAITPSINNIVVTPTNNMGSATKFWISNAGASTFRINVDADPGAGTATFSWSIV